MSKVSLSIVFTLVILFSISHSIAQVTKNLASTPLSFTENQGQWDDKVRFRANAGGATMWFASNGAYYQFTRTINSEDVSRIERQPESVETMMIKANFVGANAKPIMLGVDEMEYKCNYFIGNDKSKWATDVRNYSAIMYKEVYDGIDLKYYGNGKQMEYDFIVSPGADFSQIKIQYEGAESVAVNDNGELVVTTKWGEVIEQRPIIYQIENGSRTTIAGEYRMKGTSTFSFEISGYNPALPLVIDPVLVYSTFLGGNGNEDIMGIAIDESGAAYVTGDTWSTNFPILNEYIGTFQGGIDAFITKLNSTGDALIFSTYIGGVNFDFALDITFDATGAVYITGRTNSIDYPTLNPHTGTLQGGYDVFVTKLSSAGNSLIYSTYLGGPNDEIANSISVDSSSQAYVSGQTQSTSFPVLNAYQGTKQSFTDAFVTKLSSAGNSLVYSTFLGGTADDRVIASTLDSSGALYVTGKTASTDFPTLNPYQATKQGGDDVFVTKLSSSGDSLVYSTYLGGTDDEAGNGIAINTSGEAYLTGSTNSTDFPMLNPYQATNLGLSDIFVTKLSSAGNSLVYSTYLGGSTDDDGIDIAIDGSGAAYIGGFTKSTDFPTLDAYIGTYQGGSSDAIITKLSSSGNSLIYSTYLGGDKNDFIRSIATDTSGAVYLAGSTNSTTFPTLNPFQGTGQGLADAFVTKFSSVLLDVEVFDFDNLPSDFNLSQNYPNPFNPTTTIEFNLPKRSNVSINIYNLLGQKIQQLINQEYSSGNYRVTWDGSTSSGVKASTGIYFYRIKTDNFVETKKMILLK